MPTTTVWSRVFRGPGSCDGVVGRVGLSGLRCLKRFCGLGVSPVRAVREVEVDRSDQSARVIACLIPRRVAQRQPVLQAAGDRTADVRPVVGVAKARACWLALIVGSDTVGQNRPDRIDVNHVNLRSGRWASPGRSLSDRRGRQLRHSSRMTGLAVDVSPARIYSWLG
jgi:hypothetical protein